MLVREAGDGAQGAEGALDTRHGALRFELIFDALRDVCPVTGIVFRDSGLRHESRALLCELWAGNVDGARLLDVMNAGVIDPLRIE